MRMEVSSKGKIKIVKIIGKLNINTFDLIQKDLFDLITPGCKIIFDMSSCDFTSNSGFRILSVIVKELQSLGGYGLFSGLSNEIKDLMDITGFDNIIDLKDRFKIKIKPGAVKI